MALGQALYRLLSCGHFNASAEEPSGLLQQYVRFLVTPLTYFPQSDIFPSKTLVNGEKIYLKRIAYAMSSLSETNFNGVFH